LTRILAVLVVTGLFLPGMLIYLILRPPRTIEAEYRLALEEEAILQSFQEKPACPSCSHQMALDWIVCPWCYTRLKKKCPQCGELLELGWKVCPYCTTPLQEVRRRKADKEIGGPSQTSESESPPD
ncbi:MAG: zinc ribbon domain-containing protein, partial [Anaerolineales bacterium]|nr:zinc ribbon domain-containing protein [Anaerolineales bacterium]